MIRYDPIWSDLYEYIWICTNIYIYISMNLCLPSAPKGAFGPVRGPSYRQPALRSSWSAQPLPQLLGPQCFERYLTYKMKISCFENFIQRILGSSCIFFDFHIFPYISSGSLGSSIQIHPNPNKSIQIHKNQYKSIQIHTNSSKSIQI